MDFAVLPIYCLLFKPSSIDISILGYCNPFLELPWKDPFHELTLPILFHILRFRTKQTPYFLQVTSSYGNI